MRQLPAGRFELDIHPALERIHGWRCMTSLPLPIRLMLVRKDVQIAAFHCRSAEVPCAPNPGNFRTFAIGIPREYIVFERDRWLARKTGLCAGAQIPDLARLERAIRSRQHFAGR